MMEQNMNLDKTNNYKIDLENECGEVIIADEAVAVIAGLAAMEVEGVASMKGDATRELISKLGIVSLSKGVRVDVLEDVVTVVVAINIKYGYNIMEVAKKVQDKVKAAIENMTGFTVADVNVKVSGVELE